MTQFENPYAEPAVPPRTSGLAVTALICSLIFCCPVTTVLGVLLGLIAFATIGSNPLKKGRGIAAVAILIGIIGTVLTVWGMKVGYEKLYKPVLYGPQPALTAGFGGDTAGFKAAMHGPGASATDGEVSAFVDELRDRYGEFESVFIDGSQQTQPSFGATSQVFPYVIRFSTGTVKGEAEMVFADEATGEFVMKPSSITIFDAEKGDLHFPPEAP